MPNASTAPRPFAELQQRQIANVPPFYSDTCDIAKMVGLSTGDMTTYVWRQFHKSLERVEVEYHKRRGVPHLSGLAKRLVPEHLIAKRKVPQEGVVGLFGFVYSLASLSVHGAWIVWWNFCSSFSAHFSRQDADRPATAA